MVRIGLLFSFSTVAPVFFTQIWIQISVLMNTFFWILLEYVCEPNAYLLDANIL
jgi:hypothetical protein